MNKKKVIVRVDKINDLEVSITDKEGKLKVKRPIQKGERVPDKSYWLAFIVLSGEPRLTMYKQLYNQDF